jgi:hypothetical protein
MFSYVYIYKKYINQIRLDDFNVTKLDFFSSLANDGYHVMHTHYEVSCILTMRY